MYLHVVVFHGIFVEASLGTSVDDVVRNSSLLQIFSVILFP
jgi:hypothetical protein